MKNLKIALVATIMGLATLLGALAPQVAQADTVWTSVVVASSAQVRFEATPTGYDASTNKYKYQFAWLMPARRTYSFKIDGNMYNGKVTKNGVVETPYWFSPDITYNIQIYGAANGRGALVAQGSFLAPSIASPVPATTEQSEFEFMANFLSDYYRDVPKLSSRKVSSSIDVLALTPLLNRIAASNTFSELKSDWSSKTTELLTQTPIALAKMDTQDPDSLVVKGEYVGKPVIYKGKMNASVIVKITDSKNTIQKYPMFFIKENGVWKIDFIEMIRFSLK
ncbi:MAG TPA: hypothetical protein VHQ41_03820 [Patescibacteria group bacterium]|jgi:hypothetical protein|nr:hypothetical protein [Patescibacteria group bacterium]